MRRELERAACSVKFFDGRWYVDFGTTRHGPYMSRDVALKVAEAYGNIEAIEGGEKDDQQNEKEGRSKAGRAFRIRETARGNKRPFGAKGLTKLLHLMKIQASTLLAARPCAQISLSIR